MTVRCVDIRVVSIDHTLDGPIDIQRPYSMHVTGKLIVERVDLRWEREDLESPWMVVRASASGQRVKSDGEPGKAAASTWFTSGGRLIQPWPSWLVAMANEWSPWHESP